MASKLAIAGGFEFALICAGLVILWKTWSRPPPSLRPASPPPRWAGSEEPAARFLMWIALVMLFIFVELAAAAFTQVIVLAVLPGQSDFADETFQILGGSGLQLGMIAGYFVFGWLVRKLPAPMKPNLAALRIGGNPLKAGALVFLAALPVVMTGSLVWQNLLEAAGIEAKPQDLIGIFENTDSVPLLTLILVLAIVVAPVTEELVFRAGLFKLARLHLPRWAALILPAALFGGLHNNLSTFVPLVLLGMVFSVAFERTGDIRVSMVAHALFNLNTSVLVLLGVSP